MASCLEGVTILDLSRDPPGVFATMMLGDLGAEIIKVEEPPAPAAPPPPGGRRPVMERHSPFNALNRNKRSICLNLREDAARQVFFKLAKAADVVVDQFRPGVMQRLGVGYETLRAINPRLIYCAVTGYGQDGPYRDLPAHDMNCTSIAGVLSMIGQKDGPPVPPSNLMADFAGGPQVVVGILSALLARERTGKGQFVDVSMTDTVASLLTGPLSSYFAGGRAPERGRGVPSGEMPFISIYRTKDGKYLSIGCIEPKFWANLCHALGRDDLTPLQQDESRREDLFSILQQTFLTRTRDEWFDYLRQWDIVVSKVNAPEEMEADPQMQHRRMVMELDHPELGKVKQVGFGVKLSETPASVRRFSPRPGEHTEELLRGLGYSAGEIDAVRRSGAVR